MRSNRRIGIVIVSIVCLVTGLSIYWTWYRPVPRAISSQGTIRAYHEAQDFPFIMSLFDNNWFWLVAQSRDEYDPTFDFKHLTWNQNPYNFGKLQVRMYYVANQPIGFIAYYKKNFYEGHIWYICVEKEYRNQGYAKELLHYAIQDLLNQGCQIVTLLTRLINEHARKAYTRLGFIESSRDDTFIYYALRKNGYTRN